MPEPVEPVMKQCERNSSSSRLTGTFCWMPLCSTTPSSSVSASGRAWGLNTARPNEAMWSTTRPGTDRCGSPMNSGSSLPLTSTVGFTFCSSYWLAQGRCTTGCMPEAMLVST